MFPSSYIRALKLLVTTAVLWRTLKAASSISSTHCTLQSSYDMHTMICQHMTFSAQCAFDDVQGKHIFTEVNRQCACLPCESWHLSACTYAGGGNNSVNCLMQEQFLLGQMTHTKGLAIGQFFGVL